MVLDIHIQVQKDGDLAAFGLESNKNPGSKRTHLQRSRVVHDQQYDRCHFSCSLPSAELILYGRLQACQV